MAHDHRHDLGEGANGRLLAMTLALVLVYISVEVIGGCYDGQFTLDLTGPQGTPEFVAALLDM